MKRLLGLTALVIVLVSSFYHFREKAGTKTVLVHKTHSQIKPHKLFLKARTKTAMPKTTTVVDGCEEITAQLDGIDFNLPVADWVGQLETGALNTCKLGEFQERLQKLRSLCLDTVKELGCAQEAVFLRALLRTRGVEEASDREMLADLILKQFTGKEPNFKKMAELSEKLLDLDPNQKAYQKLWASSKVVSRIFDGKTAKDLSESILRRVDKELWDESDMQGVRLAMTTGLEPNGVEAYARGYLGQKDDGKLREILGWSLWKQGRKAEAMAELEKAIALNPKDEYLKDQLKNIKKKNASEESYQARISLGINVEDLY